MGTLLLQVTWDVVDAHVIAGVHAEVIAHPVLIFRLLDVTARCEHGSPFTEEQPPEADTMIAKTFFLM
jgi:hypothetical protein